MKVRKTSCAVKRALIAKLSPELNGDDLQMDMIYGLFKKSIRERMLPQTVKAFLELQNRARAVEDGLRDVSNINGQKADETSKRKRFYSATRHIEDKCRKKKCAIDQKQGHLNEEVTT